MALTTPILYQLPAFDANNEQIFTFNVIGGTQVLGNILTIRNNVTNAIVYQKEVTSYAFQHTLPEKTLVNGLQYNAFIQTINGTEVSAPSSPILFYCYTTPVISILNMPENNVIPNSAFEFQMQYVQIQGELLSQYQVNLYNISGNLQATSGVIYVDDTNPPPFLFNYEFTGFNDGSVYNLEILGQTVNQTAITTGRIEITVKYEEPNLFALISLENNMCEGYITIKSNMVDILGKADPDPPKYIDNDTVIDLVPGSVTYDEGFDISNDFTVGIWGRDFTENQPIFEMWNNSDTVNTPNRIIINFREEYEANSLTHYAFWEAYVYNQNTQPYYIFTPSILFPNSDDKYKIFLRRVNNLYELVAIYDGEGQTIPTVGEIDNFDFTVGEFDQSNFTVDQLDNTPILRTLDHNR